MNRFDTDQALRLERESHSISREDECVGDLTAAELVGTWRPVAVVNIRPDGSTIYPLGPDPKGILVFESNGRFAFILNRPDLPKFVSNNRNTGTAEENKAIVQGSFAYFGTYSVANRVVTMHVEGGTWPGWTGSNLDDLSPRFPATT